MAKEFVKHTGRKKSSVAPIDSDFPAHNLPVGLAPNDAERREIMQRYDATMNQYESRYPYQREATITIDTDQPVHVVAVTDVFFGSSYCNKDQFLKDLDTIRQVPGAFVILAGNLIANPKKGTSRKTDILSCDEQVAVMRGHIETLDAEGK